MNKNLFAIRVFFLLATLIVMIGCSKQQSSQGYNDADQYKFIVSLGSGTSHFSSHELNGAISHGLSYAGVQNVSIRIQDVDIPLEEAIRNGTITLSQILDKARQDSKSGLCEEITISKLGLTTFNFRYNNYNIQIIQDVFETPDGSNPLINYLRITSTMYASNAITGFLNEDGTKLLDMEDWGLTFEAASISNTDLTLTCDQANGQQLGTLHVVSYYITDENGTILPSDNQTAVNFSQEMTMGGKSALNLDWTEYYGEIPAGTYSLYLIIDDKYDSSKIHPLLRNYYDTQIYEIKIIVP